MANLTSVDIVNGVPNAGTGTVATINALQADGGMVTIGAKADAKSTATDTTAITAMQVWKQISASVQASVTGLFAKGTAGTPSTEFISVQVPRLLKASVNFTVAAGSSHTANDNVSDNGTAGSVTKLSWSIAAGAGVIRRVRIKKSDQTVVTPTIRLWLWDTTFTVASGDDAAFSQPLTDAIGQIDVAVTNAGTDDGVGWSNCDIPFSASTIYGLLQTLSTFVTAASEVFTVDIWYDPR